MEIMEKCWSLTRRRRLWTLEKLLTVWNRSIGDISYIIHLRKELQASDISARDQPELETYV